MKKVIFTMGILSTLTGFSQNEITAKVDGLLMYDGTNFGAGKAMGVGVNFEKWGVEAEYGDVNIYDKTYKTSSYNAKKYALLFYILNDRESYIKSTAKIGGVYVQKPNKGKFGFEISSTYEIPFLPWLTEDLTSTIGSSLIIGGFSKTSMAFTFGFKYNFSVKNK